MREAPRDEFTHVLIAVKGSRTVRCCVWWKNGKQWSGLPRDEIPLAWCAAYHPEDRHAHGAVKIPTGIVGLPKGMKI